MRAALLIGAAAVALSACDGEPGPLQRGPDPQLPEPRRGLLPDMTIPRPASWGNDRPAVPQGYRIEAIATDLRVPRQTLVLPNGDILVAEGMGSSAPPLRPKDVIAGFIKSLGKSSVEGGNRLTLLRDADGDGTYETRGIFAGNLNAPYGLALANGAIYVANQDSLVRFDYRDGQTEASGPPARVTDLPSAINHHWTKALAASPDGRFLYVGIGSNSNITERGMEAEVDRAMVWQVDAQTGAHRPYATGLRNPTALAIQPGTDQLWAVVNERDEIGPNLVPDYLTAVREGGFYGWPYSYWGQNVDSRAQPQDPSKVASAIRPDYALGAHVAALGLAFSTPAMGADFAEGVFVGEHGSWNRSQPVGYRVVFVPFRDGRPAGDPIDVVSGFLTDDGKARGRPVGVSVDPRGALIVADDLSNVVWRITASR
ncbi:PQQ-dependent sugar dehydrogenase [Roseicella aerolata]|uniref:Sorbosone dehydrogenase family protein n=1 Tax=Roseicella aerolata TaxID=2883479 RepID=A0A9X1IEL0_9PROT|nr:sorbosone dehydrogenase family protein [Roseicella aerolata]MCB4822674.1 sorbosone dehydrogenase family protein [Roseicella aerolata]